MLLAIDVGNTNIVIGLFSGDKMEYTWRLSTDSSKTNDEYGLIFRQLFEFNDLTFDRVNGVIISSVVPNVTHILEVTSIRYFKVDPMIVGRGTKTGMEIRYENPREIGADRITNAVAGLEKYGSPLILVDIGTAVTFDVISEDGAYLGGAIAPGLGIASNALFEKTSKLPKIDLVRPKRAIGKNTVEAMQSGIVNGYIGLVDRVIECIMDEMAWSKEKVTIISTGGFSRLIATNSKYIQGTDKLLTLYGLKKIYKMTKGEE